MGLLDGMLGSVVSGAVGNMLGGNGGANDPKAALIQGVLGMLLNNNQSAGGGSALTNVLGGLLGGQSQGNAGGLAGGLGGLLSAMTQNGLGEHAASWQGTGTNLPINPDQLGQLLNSLGGANGVGDILGQLAGHAGVSREDAAGHLSELLPTIVDQLTPNGQVANTGNLDLGGLMQQVLGR